MRSFLILLAIFTFGCSQLLACDVNLLSLFAGTSQNDEFSRRTTEIARVLQNLGKNCFDNEKSAPVVKELLQRWVEFSNKYGQFPPEWARNDQNWRTKLADLADIVGSIHKNHEKDPRQTHINAVKLSRRIAYLYEHMPMDKLARYLMKFPADFDHLWTSYYEQNYEQFRADAVQLLKDCELLPDYLPDKMRRLARNFTFMIEELNRLAASNRPFTSTALYMSLTTAEEEFSLISQKLANKSDAED